MCYYLNVQFQGQRVNHLDGTRKWTGSHPVWMEFLNLFIRVSFEEVVFLLLSPLFVSLTARLLSFLKGAIKATRSPLCLRTCVLRSTKLRGHLKFIGIVRFLRNLVVVRYFLRLVILTEWERDIFKRNRH